MLIFRQLFDPASWTYTYLLADGGNREAVLIDPVFEQVERDSAQIAELGLRLVATIDTHVHADHVTGAWLHRHRSGCRIALAKASGASGADIYLDHGDTLARRHGEVLGRVRRQAPVVCRRCRIRANSHMAVCR